MHMEAARNAHDSQKTLISENKSTTNGKENLYVIKIHQKDKYGIPIAGEYKPIVINRSLDILKDVPVERFKEENYVTFLNYDEWMEDQKTQLTTLAKILKNKNIDEAKEYLDKKRNEGIYKVRQTFINDPSDKRTPISDEKSKQTIQLEYMQAWMNADTEKVLDCMKQGTDLVKSEQCTLKSQDDPLNYLVPPYLDTNALDAWNESILSTYKNQALTLFQLGEKTLINLKEKAPPSLNDTAENSQELSQDLVEVIPDENTPYAGIIGGQIESLHLIGSNSDLLEMLSTLQTINNPEEREEILTRDLLRAIYNSNHYAAELLIGAGANVNRGININELAYTPQAHDRAFKRYPLIEAAKLNNTKMMSFLLKHGANVDTPVKIDHTNTATALAAAVENGCKDAVEFLLSQGADPNQQTVPMSCSTKKSVLEYATCLRRPDIMKLLIKAGATMAQPESSILTSTIDRLRWTKRLEQTGQFKCDSELSRFSETIELLIERCTEIDDEVIAATKQLNDEHITKLVGAKASPAQLERLNADTVL